MNLENKVIYIIGGLGRIGQEVVQGFINYSASIILIDRQNSIVSNTSFKNHPNIKFINIDSDEVEDAQRIFLEAVNNFGCPDVFINCSYPRTDDWASNSFSKLSLNSMRKNIDIHLNSYIWIAKLAADYMKEHNNIWNIL